MFKKLSSKLEVVMEAQEFSKNVFLFGANMYKVSFETKS